jgi:hypothetical protein
MLLVRVLHLCDTATNSDRRKECGHFEMKLKKEELKVDFFLGILIVHGYNYVKCVGLISEACLDVKGRGSRLRVPPSQTSSGWLTLFPIALFLLLQMNW